MPTVQSGVTVRTTVAAIAALASGGVTSINGITGALILAAGSGVTITESGETITIAAGGGPGTGLAVIQNAWNGTTSPSSPWTPNILGQVGVGNLGILFVANDYGSPDVTVAGWTQKHANANMIVFQREFDGTANDTPTLTAAGGGSLSHILIIEWEVKGWANGASGFIDFNNNPLIPAVPISTASLVFIVMDSSGTGLTAPTSTPYGVYPIFGLPFGARSAGGMFLPNVIASNGGSGQIFGTLSSGGSAGYPLATIFIVN